jgi:hypothetical protein
MRNTSKLTSMLLVASLPLMMGQDGCGNNSRARTMSASQGTQEITHSVERDNINARLNLGNNPNQIMWVYCFSDMGNVMLSSVAKGKVTSSTKRLEPRKMYNGGMTTGYVGKEAYNTDEIMGADGTYGDSDPYVFWFTPEGQYIQWGSRNYVVSSVPLKLEKPVFNTRDIDYTELARGKKAEEALKAGKKVNNNLDVERQ